MRKTITVKATILAFAIITSIVMVLTGCQSANKDVANIYLHLEKAAKMESNLVNQQNELADLLKKEQKIYTNILSVTVNNKKMDGMLEEATNLVGKRKLLLKKEKRSFQQSYKEVSQINTLIKKIEDKDLQQKAEKVAEIMNNRYKTYNKIYNKSMQEIKSNQDLYTLLLQKNSHLEKYDKQIKQMNKQTKEIKVLQNHFNKYTKEYNEAKIALYKAGNLKWKS
ncbi:YkyA family protein [Heyndrickxia sp. NPDC080065]|uniref:YkyA family protein n=1 Tax=Heyndrickxia sp. NPDC080065 TaxID=3390568 RepID=UPI003CFF8B7B